ncbi:MULTISPECIES: DMT family transporter [Thalassospira]|jgi:drug/metabolite transporter (DMT)-like permease|uniref:Multidrug DMT transporter permease n=1 Tax=Thalassospira xiamenensis TaxID=220697 RepID=A0A154KQ08_9PROT|nr:MULTISPECIES: DMT family transporter [Thalassospira]KZB51537.1 multidrug DMT transporter permease [Thalassospira xiamenensis]MAZ34310.1 EamA/RhaT family transporter [Thalassospira sp.]MCK2166554.1 DMT family transporter [Thalassospira xiamenensis]RCK48201.1 multidrug DMT transporter permease [Thalassospira xiamenensis]SOB95309.1 Threonine/homoserine efflux transporter RhtA [Thalassospira xiamenensis]
MDEKLRGTVEMTAAMTILGTIGWFVVMSGQSALDVVFWRCVFGAGALLVVCAGMGFLRGLLNLRILGWAALGGVAIVTNWFLLFQSYSMASISISTAVYNTQPFMLVMFGALLFGEKLTANKFAWLAIAFGGLLLIISGKPDGGFTGTNYAGGIAMALVAAFFWAVAAIITKKLKGTPPHLIALIQVCVGILLLAPFANLDNLPDTPSSWGALVTVGVVHTGIMYVLMYGAVQKLPTHLQGSLSFIYPVVAILVDLIAFGYRPDTAQIIGAVAIVIAATGMNLGWQLWRSGKRNPARNAAIQK